MVIWWKLGSATKQALTIVKFIEFSFWVLFDGNMYEIPRPVRCKNRKKYTSKKNNHTKIVFTWFDNLLTSTELQGFHYSQGKNTDCGSTVFLSSLKKRHKKPNFQNNSFYILHTRFIMGYKNGPIFFFPRVLPPDPQWGLSMSTTAWAY